MTSGERLRHALREHRVDRDLVEIDEVESELGGECA
jgi:hypothetical protein